MKKKMKSLLQKIMLPFIGATFLIMLISAPVFFIVAEDAYKDRFTYMVKKYNIELTKRDRWLFQGDEDIAQGMALQYGLILLIMMIYMIFTLRYLSKRLWKSFDETLNLVEDFSLEQGESPQFPETDTIEFARLNTAVQRMMNNSLVAYKTQKEFTENASHELQTPLAIIQSQLDMLIQHPDLTEEQSELVSSLYQTASHLTRLNKNLLLLAKIENRQYGQDEDINLGELLEELLPSFTSLIDDDQFSFETAINKGVVVKVNRILVTSLFLNLISNAVHYNKPGEIIRLELTDHAFSITNVGNNSSLDKKVIFNRFNKHPGQSKGHGLGLAIVYEICRYHGWGIDYQYEDEKHKFIVSGFIISQK
ncbi:HAMP domain-containing sensor histidine kinase [Parabacteroides sp. PF5-9]|uniref:sensor histidine kinase n=1 Tax=Parabacteroides sp. PF5-9 TaxID=1742404 RepID=UPI0024771D28|nr:HAMP domain-containing sensor histidine kinase [Parabacteroides sp. PF5-9]MDH6356614.1 two-component system OmpR family sensor kinase [Parabacteroides sp. PF5-9]